MIAVLVNTLFYEAVDALLNVVDRLAALMRDADVPYELVGGMAVFLHVRAISEENARLTNDVHVAIRRADLERIKLFAPSYGFTFRHAAGIDMLIDAHKATAKGAVHLLFAGEKVRPDYVAPVPNLPATTPGHQVNLAPIEHLLQMKLTSNRLKDMTHVRDLLDVGLITPAMEAALPPILRERLEFIKAHE